MSVVRWLCWLALIGLFVAAPAAPRSARAATCHAPDRPALGLDRPGFAPPVAELDPVVIDPASPPAYRPVPCSDNPAVRPDRATHLAGWLAPMYEGFLPRDLGAAPSAPAIAPRRVNPASRLERPPRHG